MKRFFTVISIYLLLVAANCSGNQTPSLKELEKSKMNFPDLEKRAHETFTYQLSRLFTDAYSSHFVLQKNSTTKSIHDLNIYFSIETFGKNDLETIRFLNESKKGDLELIHDHYIGMRLGSLDIKTISTRKKLMGKAHFPGYIQHVIGKGKYETKNMIYMISTVEIDESFHVFQLIGPNDNMGYFYDDFLRILNSIEK
jgi:hypothetical protein